MTKKEFMKEHDEQSSALTKEFGSYFYFLGSEILNLSYYERELENLGFEIERITKNGPMNLYTILKMDGKTVGNLRCTGAFPEVMIDKRKRKYAKIIAQLENAIAPIKGVHSVLEWHTIKDKKLHCLAGGQTLIHLKPLKISVEDFQEWINRCGINDAVTDMKEREKEHKLNQI